MEHTTIKQSKQFTKKECKALRKDYEEMASKNGLLVPQLCEFAKQLLDKEKLLEADEETCRLALDCAARATTSAISAYEAMHSFPTREPVVCEDLEALFEQVCELASLWLSIGFIDEAVQAARMHCVVVVDWIIPIILELFRATQASASDLAGMVFWLVSLARGTTALASRSVHWRIRSEDSLEIRRGEMEIAELALSISCRLQSAVAEFEAEHKIMERR